ncbi:MAG: hypothetical protein E7299_12090 [Lachnospiraceae bacterium]|nr:hypothetical protein [Lachnospiraceae bacterium]
MKKVEILKQISDIMACDAACCKDKKDEVLHYYVDLVNENMSDNEFLLTVNSYLSTFGLTGHLFFKKQGHKGLPFRVCRFGDILYVTEVTKDSLLAVGDKIIEINGDSVKAFYEKYRGCFYGESLERQTPHWNFILKYADEIGFVTDSNDEIQHWKVEVFDWDSSELQYYFTKINSDVAYLKFADFADSTGILTLLQEHDSEICNTKNLIIDVRGNGGGNGFSYYPLLKYCLPNGKTLCDLYLTDSGMLQYGQEILYSERNCDVRIEILVEMMQKNMSTSDEDIFKQAISKLRELRGSGFVKEREEVDSEITGDSNVDKVIILTDSSCCSAGDSFVYLFKMLPKVKVVGRSTQGILDYSNVAYALFDEYALVYPTSRLLSLDYGKGMMGKGIPVDTYIPWTPEHLKRDVDLEYVLTRL